jgi:protein tyrosine/serine phosphatase
MSFFEVNNLERYTVSERMMLPIRMTSLLAVLFVVCVAPAADRDTNWAVKVEQGGVPNLHRVTTLLYRSAQPSAEGLRAAEKLGIKTIISLRAFHSDKDELESTKLRTERIYFNTWYPEEEDVVKFLKLVSNTNNGPFLVHCQHGADRTGTMIAIYRMTVQGWKKDAAIKEMREGGFNYHEMWKNLVKYLNAVDVNALRKKAGIPPPGR